VLADTALEAGPGAGHNIDLEGDHTGPGEDRTGLAGDRRTAREEVSVMRLDGLCLSFGRLRDWAVEDNHRHHHRRHSILGQT
jgi:hypothetical protein